MVFPGRTTRDKQNIFLGRDQYPLAFSWYPIPLLQQSWFFPTPSVHTIIMHLSGWMGVKPMHDVHLKLFPFHLIALGLKSICAFWGMLSLAGISWEKYKMNCTQTPYFSFPKKYIIISLSFSGSFFMLGWLSNDPHLSKFLGSQNLMFWPPWETGSSFLYKGECFVLISSNASFMSLSSLIRHPCNVKSIKSTAWKLTQLTGTTWWLKTSQKLPYILPNWGFLMFTHHAILHKLRPIAFLSVSNV